MSNELFENRTILRKGTTLYGDTPKKKRIMVGGTFGLFLAAVIVLLFVVHALNLGLWWKLAQAEISEIPAAPFDRYQFLGFSSYDTARQKLDAERIFSKNGIVVVSYFDLLHSAVFLVHNGRRPDFVNLGMMTLYAPQGTTAYYFYPSEILETRVKEKTTGAFFYGNAVIASFYRTLADYMARADDPTNKNNTPVSFAQKNLEESKYLAIPYYIYFYLPLLIILAMSSRQGKGVYIAFFYYLGLFLLFDAKTVLFTAPFAPIIKLTGLSLASPILNFVAPTVAVIFVILGVVGVLSCRKKKFDPENKENILTPGGKAFNIFFLLLPLFLRF